MNSAFSPLRPLKPNGAGQVSKEGNLNSVSTEKRVFQALWRKKSGKKNKTWEGDGIAIFNGGFLSLKSEQRQLFKITCAAAAEGDIFSGGVYECELGSVIETYSATPPQPVAKPPPQQLSKMRVTPLGGSNTMSSKNVKRAVGPSLQDLISAPLPRVGPALKRPGQRTLTPLPKQKKKQNPVVNLEPTQIALPQNPQQVPDRLTIDYELLGHLRPHQIDAVQFLYRCVEGKAHSYGRGALLADEMGLGKTLTSITLIFSMIKAGLIKNCLIVCPVTLLRNWKNEFKKWIGEARIGIFTASPDVDVANFFRTSFKTYQVMLAGYERMVRIADELSSGMQQFDLVVCDEGHRLKGLNTKFAQAIASVSGDRRLILTGTPVQNNLAEFYALADYLNPSIFGSAAKFAKRFSDPVAAARCPEASEITLEAGKEATEELVEIVKEFVIRRDFTVLTKYVQVSKTEQVVFCRPFASQAKMYQSILSSTAISGCLDGNGQGEVLKAISMLRKIATSTLLAPDGWKLDRSPSPEKSGGKLQVLANLMRELRSKTDEKLVIVSGSTATLDLVQTMCSNLELQWLRLDGSTPQDQRQNLVDLFNRTANKRAFAFLLSARSGGAGLNLIGASRLVLLDSDWNPAIDLQAMARIFRDGQKRPVYIYRFLTTGTIDEKIFQRQLTKHGLSSTVLDLDTVPDKFSKDQLRDLFSFSTPELCDTVQNSTHENLRISPVSEDKMLADSEGSISCVLRVVE